MNVVARTAQRVRSWFTGTPVLVTPNLTFVYQGRRKPQFLADNRATFDQLFAAANAALTKQYGAAARPVTREDMWLIVHCEAGLKGGFVDPDCKDHSLGERGLLPLPKNITDWNGPSAPVWNQPMPLTTNLFHYAVYIGQIKNKLEVLTTLFDTAGIKSRPDRHARLAAGIVHGYFYSGCYEGAVPRQQLIEGYQADQDLLGMLTGTTYVHMRPDRQPKGRNILVDRQANIIAALHDLAATPALPVMTVKQNTDLLETDTVGAVSLGTLTAFAVRLIVDAQLPSGRSRVHLESAADVSGYVASALLVPMPEA